MKKTRIKLIAGTMLICSAMFGQESNYTKQMMTEIAKLDSAKTINDCQVLGNDFARLSGANKKDWLPFYYAAFCNAKIGFIHFARNEKASDKMELFNELCETQINTALSLIDTVNQKKELSEIYGVMSMMYRTKIFISPMTNGKKYGPTANLYIVKAKMTDSTNARATYLDGWLKYYTPKLWGGDQKKAKLLLDKALQQLSNEHPKPLYPHWGKAECEEILKLY